VILFALPCTNGQACLSICFGTTTPRQAHRAADLVRLCALQHVIAGPFERHAPFKMHQAALRHSPPGGRYLQPPNNIFLLQVALRPHCLSRKAASSVIHDATVQQQSVPANGPAKRSSHIYAESSNALSEKIWCRGCQFHHQDAQGVLLAGHIALNGP
jgi:hypothetical protein